MRYRLVIFDFDGTLADTFPSFLRHMEQIVERFKLRRIDPDGLERLRGCGAREIMAELGLPLWKVPMVAKAFRELMAEDVGQTQLFPGVPQVLECLIASGCLLAIVSSNAERNIRTVLGEELAGKITVFECGAALFGKAARFRKVLKRTGIPAAEAVAVGDEIRDLEAAQEAKIVFGAVSWGYTKPEALKARSPAWIFSEISEVEKLANDSAL